MDNRPNILWIMTDEQRKDSLGCYGSTWAHSPSIDRIAREGIVFENAYTPAPVCVPARAALCSGCYPSHLGMWHNKAHREHLPHLTAIFEDAGYRTANYGKIHYNSKNKAFQYEDNIVIKNDIVHYFHYGDKYKEDDYDVVKYPGGRGWVIGGRFPEPAECTAEAEIVQKSIQWLEQHDHNRPFLLRLSFNAPHTPPTPPSPFDTLISENAIKFSSQMDHRENHEPGWIEKGLKTFTSSALLTKEQIRKMRRYYYGQAAFVDQQIGTLLDWMQSNHLLENTIIAFVSDHGTHLGDYGLIQKQTFFEPVASVPFFFWYPKQFTSGKRICTPVETISLLPTLIEAAELDIPNTCDGVSLSATLHSGTEPESRPVFSEFTLGSSLPEYESQRLVMVREGKWKLTLCLDPEWNDFYLYNLEDDPCETTNLFSTLKDSLVAQQLLTSVSEHVSYAQST